MKIVCAQDELLARARRSPRVAYRSARPFRSCRASWSAPTADGVELLATDMELSLRVPLQARVEEPGDGRAAWPAAARDRACAAGRRRHDRVSRRNGAARSSAAPASTRCTRRAPRISRSSRSPPASSFSVDRAAFVDTVVACRPRRVQGRVAPGADRRPGRASASGTRDHGRHRQLPDLGQGLAAPRARRRRLQAIVPARALGEVARIGRAARRWRSRSSENQVLFGMDGVWLSARRIDGQFPNYRQLLPQSFEHEVAIAKDELLDVIRRTALMAQRNPPLRLALRARAR